MSIEGGLVLPIFLLFMLTVLLSLEEVRFQSNVWEALSRVGSNQAVTLYAEKNKENAIDAEQEVKQYLDMQFLPYLCVKDGREGLQLRSVLRGGKIEMEAEYRLAEVIWWLPIGEIVIVDRAVIHGWTGYSGEEDGWIDQEKLAYVYVTKTGSKYHRNRECSYLKVQIKTVEATWLEEGRNKWGGKYYPCSKCKPQKTGMVYVTEDGRNYHSYRDCSGLKRTVYMLFLSEADRYDACSRCG